VLLSLPHAPGLRRHALITLAVLLLSSAAAAMVLLPHNMIARSAAMLAVLAAVHLSRKSKGPARLHPASGPAPARPGRPQWAIGIALGALWLTSYFCMYQDSLHGGRAVWPVYLFASVGFVCAVFWAYLFTAGNI
jgi:hypothetical protein